MIPFRRDRANALRGKGESYCFRQTVGSGVSVLRFDGEPTVTRELDREVDVSLAATASDLFLFLWRRMHAASIEVEGDYKLLERYFEVVPPL